ncbi:hypothetical protein M408DRAFT_330559 [Serendipita vermifera MAFF 305830]|uniref:Pantoate--beta-alanine ligase n=1 Tax=Serendipita vermifera MAFF 305830 TaxID=933852 RepID=A0A0C2XBX7_SERVB|nr:hypothetical protein M408DRAFT_330559 [Serendipita vermifera MAFF 305830]
MATTGTSSMHAGEPDVEIIDSIAALRAWRQRAREQQKDVGFVPTMGALHEGHLDLVRESLRGNQLTVVSIFVNPAQFAPHEDLATYPRTLESDLRLLRGLSVNVPRTPTTDTETRKPSAVFIPPVKDMYPSGITTNVAEQRGAFVQVKGLEEEMEGKSRPGFFRGVATVVLKLFNAVEPTNAYFGQKDIQQGLLLRRLTSDLLLSHPAPENLHIVPTHRDSTSGLALSSRNMYLTETERTWAPTLWRALQAGKKKWEEIMQAETDPNSTTIVKGARDRVVNAATEVIQTAVGESEKEGVSIRPDYIQLNWTDTFEVIGDVDKKEVLSEGTRGVILSGALWVGRTRLIDNIILGHPKVVKQIIS